MAGGILFPDIAGALSAGASAGAASVQNQFLMKDRAARDEIAPLIPKALAGDKEALGQIGTRHPDTAMKLAPLLDRLDANKRAKVKEDSEFITSNGMAILNAPPEAQPQLYARVRQEAQASGRDVSQWPTTYDPGWVKFNVDKAMPFAEHFKRNGEGVTFAPPAGSGQGAPAPGGGDRAAGAIGGIESGGKYDAIGPAANDKGNRAYGKYQIMDFNVGPWTQEVLGQAMTPQQFLANPQAQDAVFKAKFAQYEKQYGSPEAASRAWFAGPGGMNNPGAKDVLGTSVQNYGQKFAQAYGPGANGSPPGIAQGSDMPAADGSGTPLPPAQQALAPLRGLQIPPGARVALQGGVPIVKDGNVLYLDANGGWGAAPLPARKEPGPEKGLFGDSLTGRALSALRTLPPDSQDYAAAYAILSKPQVISDGAGGQTVIQPMDLSMYPKPAYGRGGQPAPGGPAPTPPPGGPTITNIPGKGKPLDNSSRDDLIKKAGPALEMAELVKSFDPSFGGFTFDALGESDNFRKRNLPDSFGGKDEKGQAQWWQRYQAMSNIERNALFGASLTEGETKAWKAATVTPGMKPDQIKANLTRQNEIAQKALSRLANSLAASGFNKEAIEAAIGVRLSDMPSPIGGAPQPQDNAEKGRLLFDARKAIDQGAPRDKVIERLKAAGITEEP